jgi:membrane protein
MEKNKSKFMSIFNEIVNKLNDDHISEYSAQCSYYTILSFIPFIILLITLIQYTNVDQQTLFNIITKIMPTSMSAFVLDIIKEVYSKSFGTISISIIFTLWSAGKGLYALMKGLNQLYNVQSKKGKSFVYLKLMSIVKTAVFIVLIAVSLTVLVFGNTLISIIKNHFGGFEHYTYISSIITEVGLILGVFMVFLFVYKFMPKHKVSIKSQIIGAIFSAITLNIISYIFSKYLDIFKGFSITYGSLTTLMLIMMWIYACFYIIFLGAEINKVLENKRKERG